MGIEKSIVGEFHNQKEPDFDPDSGVTYPHNSKNYRRYHKYKELMGGEKEMGASSEIVDRFKTVVGLINDTELIDEYKNNPEQKKLLETKKEDAIKKIKEVVKKIDDYMLIVQQWDESKSHREDLDEKDDIQNTVDVETLRKLSHNALVSELHSAIRFISYNFGKIDEEAIEEWKEEQEDKDLPIPMVKRIDLPQNVLCPDNLNVMDKKQISAWAGQFYFQYVNNLKRRLPF